MAARPAGPPKSGEQTSDVQTVNSRTSLPAVGNVALKAPPGLSSRSGPASQRGLPRRHFLDQKKVAKEGAPQGLLSSITPVGPEVRASLSLPRESDKERPGSPPDPRAGRQPSSGGCRPGLPLDSRPNPGLHWPPGRTRSPYGAAPGSGASAQPATGRGRFWASATPWVGCRKWGPKGSLEPLRI